MKTRLILIITALSLTAFSCSDLTSLDKEYEDQESQFIVQILDQLISKEFAHIDPPPPPPKPIEFYENPSAQDSVTAQEKMIEYNQMIEHLEWMSSDTLTYYIVDSLSSFKSFDLNSEIIPSNVNSESLELETRTLSNIDELSAEPKLRTKKFQHANKTYPWLKLSRVKFDLTYTQAEILIDFHNDQFGTGFTEYVYATRQPSDSIWRIKLKEELGTFN